jgi:hypothetical protein
MTFYSYKLQPIVVQVWKSSFFISYLLCGRMIMFEYHLCTIIPLAK